MEQRINLLLIGETGVGKSTWINAFANYCSFETVQEAEEAGGKFPISCNVTVRDTKTGESETISSECTGTTPTSQTAKVGESDTQEPNEYVFKHENTEIALIDTPGLLDTKDVGTSTHHTDKEHVNNILRLLSTYSEIHAICIFLKASESRLSEAFKYVISEVLSHLDQKAINNVIFVLTYAASTNFKSDTTQPILDKFLTEKKLPIPLPPSKATVYCFENNPVQYLVKRKNKRHTDQDDKDEATKNWRKSKDKTAEMISYVCALDPLPLDWINAIYDAECTIGIVSNLVLDTLKCIADYKSKLECTKEEADKLKAQITSSPKEFQPFHIKKLTTCLLYTSDAADE